MSFTRRKTLGLGLTALAGIGLSGLLPRAAFAQEGTDTYPAEGGDITIHPVSHASFVLTVPGLVIYNDPVGGAAAYEGLEPPGLILVSHEHGDHFDPATLTAIAGGAKIIANPAVYDMLPADLKANAVKVANGEFASVGGLQLNAIPAYNSTADRAQYHPQGRDNGYVLTVAGKRIYIAGDTEDIPEMRELTGIDIAFVPMVLPYTMDETQAASGVAAFKPGVVYPYHYGESDLDKFESELAAQGGTSEVKRGNWYPS